MINFDVLEEITAYQTEVLPSNNLFEELGRNTYDYKDLLSELIDNCIAARRSDVTLDVVIDIYVNQYGKASDFIIRDNAKGIPVDKMGTAISPAGFQSTDSLNEHGLGMKQAVSGLGKLKYLATKVIGEDKGRLIKEFKFGNISTYSVDFPGDSGTEIAITDLKPIVITHPTAITNSVMPYLEARYRRFMRPDKTLLNLKMNLRQIEEPDGIKNNWIAQERKPIYFHPATRKNEPVILKHRLEGNGWCAEFTFGYAPSENGEYEELGLQVPTKFDPYKVTLGKQGLDVIFHDRVILFHQLSELELVPTRHPNYNAIRGEIDLKNGFSTATTKNSVISDSNFVECLRCVRDIINGNQPGPNGKSQDYLKHKRYPEELPESLLRDRLADWLQTNPVHPRKDVKKEFAIEGVGGFIDILADGEAWELKINPAIALDVFQLFMYMDVQGLDKGFLVAPSFSTGATVAKEHIATRHNKEIVLASREQFPINHAPNEIERYDYF